MQIKEFLILLAVAVLSAVAVTAIACWAIDDEFKQQDQVIKAATESNHAR